MQLEYNVLWIDNEIESYYIARGQLTALESFINDLGFETKIIPLIGEENLYEHLNKTKFDLIISDYNLDDDKNGDQLVKEIRDQGLMTEILFYSGNSSFMENTDVQKQLAFLDRISFHAGRAGLIDKIEDLIKLTVTKLLDLNATRGIIMASTSSLDALIEEITIIMCRDHLEKDETHYNEIMAAYINDCLDTKSTQFKSTYEEKGFQSALRNMEAFRKWRLFRELLKELKSKDTRQDLLDFYRINSTYSEEVIKIRNKFAHAKAETVDGKMVLIGKHEDDHFQVGEEESIAIRKNLIKHKNNFSRLRSILIED